jgi:translin
METLKTILNETRKELTREEKVRDSSYRDLRKATSLSKQAILFIHQRRFGQAQKSIEKARKIISKVKNVSSSHPSIIHSGSYSATLQEYSEANIFMKLIQESRFVTPEEIDAPSTDYVLGLADVIGEYRRAVLDALRRGYVEEGERHLRTMDQIYIELMALDESYMLVPGLRRKCDVARKIIEITRGDVTQEIRRNQLEKHLRQFEKQVRAKK